MAGRDESSSSAGAAVDVGRIVVDEGKLVMVEIRRTALTMLREDSLGAVANVVPGLVGNVVNAKPPSVGGREASDIELNLDMVLGVWIESVLSE